MQWFHSLQFVVMLLGLVAWLLIDPAKYPRLTRVAEACKLAYFAGLLSFLMLYRGSL